MTWIEKFCNKIWPQFQVYYDWIDSWDYDPKTKELMKSIWNMLSPVVKAAILAFITKMITEYGPDKGKEILDGIMSKISPIKTA